MTCLLVIIKQMKPCTLLPTILFAKKTAIPNAILKLNEVDSKHCHGVQLCNLLLGAVLSSYHKDASSERKQALS